MNEKYQAICEMIARYEKVGVCLSGGSDSALLTVAAVNTLGKQNVTAITAHTSFFTGEEVEVSIQLCQRLGIEHLQPRAGVLLDPDVVKNGENRCLYCKRNILKAVHRAAVEKEIDILLDGSCAVKREGAAVDPNRKVSRDIHVISPLREVGMTKEEASGLLKELGYREFIRYENTCMATRIAIGEPITIKKIRNIRAAENYLAGMGFSCVRVRSKGSKARIEVEKSQVDDLIQMQEEVREELLNLGFDDVEIDPEGYRESGYRCGI